VKLLDAYSKLEKEIYKYFGIPQTWYVFPLDDSCEHYWSIKGGEVHFSKSKKIHEKLVKNGYDYDELGVDDYYTNEIYTYKDYENPIFRGKDYTAICVDTHTDGNKFLQILDNKKEIKKETK